MNDSDDKIQAEQAEAILRRSLGTRVSGLRIVIHAEGVIMEGNTFSYHAKQLAQHAVMRLLGLPVMANQIKVRPAPVLPNSGSADLG